MEKRSRSSRPGSALYWQGLSTRSECRAPSPLLYAFSIFVIFLCLAALYESWPIPISILLVFRWEPSAASCDQFERAAQRRIFPDRAAHDSRLTTKNAILIVQFAKQGWNREWGFWKQPWKGPS